MQKNKNIHRSDKLDSMLGKRVKIILFDRSVYEGVLDTSEHTGGYKIHRNGLGMLHFYKTHVKKIELI